MKLSNIIGMMLIVVLFQTILIYSQDLSNLELIAHYPLKGTANDTTGNYGPMDLTNTPFQDGGIYCNGNYIGDDPDSCDAATPKITDFNFKSFAVSVNFKVDEVVERRPIIIGGKSWRWFGMFTDPNDTTVGFAWNAYFETASSSEEKFSLGLWHEITSTYDSTEGKGRLYLDGMLVDSIMVQLDHHNVNIFTITHGAIGAVFKGLLKDLKIYSKSLSEFEQDSLALVALYNSTDGANWTNNDNWKTEPVSTWYGITVSDGRVTEIDLQSNNLTGNIPHEIGDLDSLELLQLFYNQLSDTIPNEIYNLTKLTGLWLRDNQLTGAISPQIGNLINLKQLWLCNNQLTDIIPNEICDLVHLEELMLFENQLIGTIPADINNLVNLERLSLSRNQLTGEIPSEIGDLVNLNSLLLSDNQFTDSIPTEIGQLVNLNALYLNNNQLVGTIPNDIGNLTNLTNLRLNYNQLSDTIPNSIWSLVNLTNLYLNSNQLEGPISDRILDLKNLQYFSIQWNKFTNLPDISSITTLIDVKISGNRFTFEDIEPNITITNFDYSPQDSVGAAQDTTVVEGTFLTITVVVGGAYNHYQWFKDGSSVIGAVSSDYTIDPVNMDDAGVYTCDITNTLATELTLHSRPIQITVVSTELEQDSLALVALYDSTGGASWTNHTNWLTGPVETWYGVTVVGDRVEKIELEDNGLNGPLPPEIGDLTHLTVLNVRRNQVSGTLPMELFDLINLTDLDLYKNDVTGSLPPEIGNLINLTHLNFHSNELTGPIPYEIGNLKQLTTLAMRNNQLSDSIPSSIGNMTSLEKLYLYGNQLSGPIPSSIGNCVNLRDLFLYNNQLSGPIPSEIYDLPQIKQIELQNNQLEGPISSQIENLTNLIYINLGNNPIQGSIPPEIGSLGNMEYVNLWKTQLTGSIPDEIWNLTNLMYLNLNDNQLIGSIPPEIGNLVNLVELLINSNQLEGALPPEIGSCSALRMIDLIGNQLSGAIPDEIGNLANLTALYLTNNQFSESIPESIGNLSSISSLQLGHNQFTGTITKEIGNCTTLTDLRLNNNQFTDTIPSEFGNLVLLKNFSISNNQLSGPVPEEMANLNNLEYLIMNHNQLTELPDLSSIATLLQLYVFNNRFTFEDIEPNIGIPEFNYSPQDSVGEERTIKAYLGSSLTLSVDVGGTQNQYQWLKDGSAISGATLDDYTMDPVALSDSGTYHCQITNTLVTDLTLYSRLMHVTVDTMSGIERDSLALVALYDSTDGNNWTNNENWLTGSLDTWYGITIESGRVVEVHLPDNNLIGSIPSEIGWMTALQELYLQSNELEGNVPSEIGSLTNLKEISFDHNDLSGAIPASIGNLTKLEKLGFGYNRFSETIPDTIGNLTNLQHLSLHMNRLTGSIPTALANLTQLTELYLYHNKLSDSIPSGLGSLTHLTRLYLQSNDLEGAVPSSFTNLTELVWLRLSYNHLDGLPDLSSISTLTQLSAAGNRFTFEDIEPNVGITDFTYTPQDSVGEKKDTTITEGENMILFITVGGSANQYQWFKNGVEIPDSDSSAYGIESIALSDSGSYNCQITNTLATELTLYARPVNVSVEPGVGVASRNGGVPYKFALLQNYPNPFNPDTKIEYHLPQPSEVKLVIYDVRGQVVRELVQGIKPAGYHEVVWNSQNSEGQKVATGIYIYRIEINSSGDREKQFVDVKKMVLMK